MSFNLAIFLLMDIVFFLSIFLLGMLLRLYSKLGRVAKIISGFFFLCLIAEMILIIRVAWLPLGRWHFWLILGGALFIIIISFLLGKKLTERKLEVEEVGPLLLLGIFIMLNFLLLFIVN